MMAKKRILSWLVAASLALSLLPAAALAADKGAQNPTAQETLETVKEAAKNAIDAKDDAVTAMGSAQEAQKEVEEIAEKVSEDNKTTEAANETYTNGQKAESIVNGANDAVEEKAGEIAPSIDLSDPNAVSDAVNGKIDSVDEKAQEALDAITKANEAEGESLSLAQKAEKARDDAKNALDGLTENSDQEAIRDAANKAQAAANIARDAADKAQAAVDGAKAAYDEVLQAAQNALAAAKDIDDTLRTQANLDANETVETANEVTTWIDGMDALKAEGLKDIIADPDADLLQKDLAQAKLNYLTAQEEAAKAADEASKAKEAADTAKQESTLSAITSVLDVDRNALVIDKDTNVTATKKSIDDAASAYTATTKNDYDKLFNGKGKPGDYHPVVKSDIEKENLPVDEVIKLQERLASATTNKEKKEIAVAFGVNPARVPIDIFDNIKNEFLEKDLPRMLNARINLLTAEDTANSAKEAANAVVDAQVAQQRADEAKSAADKAFAAYEKARTALIEREKLNELHQQTLDLTALQAKLDAAEQKWQDAQNAADEAQGDADAAQEYADQVAERIDDGDGDGNTGGGDGNTGGGDGNTGGGDGNTGTTGGTGTGDTDTGDDDTTIEDGIVPLAGLINRQILVSYLYTHEGSPDGVDAEGEYTLALAWAVANDIVDEEDDPEELVTVAILRDVMTRYAKLLNRTFDVEIPGEDDDIVMNCGEILAEFFGD